MMVNTDAFKMPCKFYVDYDKYGIFLNDDEKDILVNKINNYIIQGFEQLRKTTVDNFLIEHASYDETNTGAGMKTSLHIKVMGCHFQHVGILNCVKEYFISNRCYRFWCVL